MSLAGLSASMRALQFRGFAFTALLVLAPILGAAAQTYPDKPVRMVVPFAAGGTSDILARVIGPVLKELMGQPIVIDNRPGAGSNIGADLVAKSAPDGYTLLMATPALSSNPVLYRNLSYDPQRDLTPVTLVCEIPIVLIVHPSVPAKTVTELVDYLKAQSGKANFGSSGNGGIGHLVGEMFKAATGVGMVHVPYRGNGPALNDLVSGRLTMLFSDVAGALPYISSGQVRALAITSERRSAALPQVPTMVEAGVRGFQATSWFGVFVPAGVPKPIVEKLSADIARSIRSGDTARRLGELQFELVGSTPDAFAEYFRREVAKWTEVVKKSGATVD
jgi:tripartite-type tricarboxylate transporter receptor subunit TctC